MEFDFKYPLDSQHEVTVTVEGAGKDCLVSLSFPHETGEALDRMLEAALAERPLIEAVAWEQYQVRLSMVAHDRKGAGVAGDRESA